MKNILILILVLWTFTSCKSTFTGSITYTTEIEYNSGGLDTLNYYQDKYGDTLVIDYYKNGDMVRTHLNGEADYQFYNAKKGTIFYAYKDTTQNNEFSVDFNSLEVNSRKQLKDEIIIGESCSCYEISTTDKDKGYPMTIKNCYPKDREKFYLNPELYKTYKDFRLYEDFQRHQTPYFKYYIILPWVTIKYDGVSYEKKHKTLHF